MEEGRVAEGKEGWRRCFREGEEGEGMLREKLLHGSRRSLRDKG